MREDNLILKDIFKQMSTEKPETNDAWDAKNQSY